MAALALSSQAAYAQEAQDDSAEQAAASILQPEIIVTARRKAEDIQKVPISVTALGSDQLRAAGITKVSEIAAVVPGLNLFFVGSETNAVYSIRAMSRGSLGFQQPAVTTYVNDVPTTIFGAALPTYDLGNLQVLKGPQGTLFGRNSEAGAILTNTRQPTYDYNGYADLQVGDYSWMKAEGALNIPVIEDKLAIRVAGVVNRRDGYQKNLSFPGRDFANLDSNAFRVSVLAEPFEGLKNVFVYENFSAATNGIAAQLLTYDPNSMGLPNNFAGTPFAFVIPLTQQAYEDQLANGPRTGTAPFPLSTRDKRETISNTTSLDIGSVTIKNIFGYQKNYVEAYVNQAGYAFPLIPGYRFVDYRQVTEELQLSGKAFNDALTYIVGGFYLDFRPSGTAYELVAPPGTYDFTVPSLASPGPPPVFAPLGSGNYYRDKSKSAYSQINLAFGAITPALEGLSIDAGLRYSKDDHSLCSIGGQLPQTAASEDTCLQDPARKASSSEDFWSYTLGVNYQVTPEILFYGVTRRGYRSGGLNAPILGGTLAAAGAQSFSPETVTDYEVGLKSRFALGTVPVTFNLALFQADYKDLQYAVNTNGINQVLAATGGVDGDFNPGNNPTALYFANVGDGRVKGLEAALSVRPVPSLQLSGGMSVLDFAVNKNTFVPPVNFPAFLTPGIKSFEATVFYGAPKFSYNASVAYTLPLPSEVGDVVMRAKVNGSGKINYDAITVPARAVLDLRLDWNSVLGSDVDLSAFVTNVTDKLYVAAPNLGSPGAFAFTSGTYNEPRIFGFEARWHFGPQ
ncbi:hypothetical protein NSU_3451 [Novosphingobium pentaromativorans US6-1]|uniref:TonB-dependent receptor n=1 Tax=Novosphingobium pentaromativorans US6-1 TaxID=1088721 RepID=G6EGM1_9SPHN|nr:hypothetical protein NSU_3451 [Novosphingobium pentaromativorans US6-1]